MTATNSLATWVRSFRSTTISTSRLVCFPHAGGSASFFRSWALSLPSAVDVRAIQYPGREDRLNDAMVSGMAELSETLAKVLVPLLDRPVFLFGHSLGAAVAYEVTKRLRALDRGPIARLFVSSQPAPHRRRAPQPHSTRDDNAIVAELRRLGVTASDMLDNPEIRDLILPAVRNDYRLDEEYRPALESPLECAVTAFIGDADTEATPDEMRAWQDCTRGAFSLRVLEGDHFYLVPRRSDVLAEILECVEPYLPRAHWPSTP